MPGHPYLGEGSEDLRDRAHFAQRGVAAEVAAPHPLGAPPLQEERTEHDREHRHVDGGRAGRVPEEDLAEDPQADGGAHGHAQSPHPADHGGRDRHEQRLRAGDGTQVRAQDRCGQHGGDARQPGRDHPGDAGQPADRDAEEQGALVGVGGGLDRHPGAAAGEEHPYGEEDDRHRHHSDEVVAGEHDRPDLPRSGER